MTFDYDVVVIGSGFGGSVSALRLVEKGYHVAVLEAGARFDDAGFAKTSWDTKRFLFAPKLGWYGIQRISALRHVIILSGAGVAAAAWSMQTRCTSRCPRSTPIGSGPTSPTGKTSSRRTTTRPSGCSG